MTTRSGANYSEHTNPNPSAPPLHPSSDPHSISANPHLPIMTSPTPKAPPEGVLRTATPSCTPHQTPPHWPDRTTPTATPTPSGNHFCGNEFQSGPYPLPPVPEWRTTNFLACLPTMMKSGILPLSQKGKNFAIWNFCIIHIVERMTKISGYFNNIARLTSKPKGDDIVKAMIKHTVHEDLTMKIITCQSAVQMTQTLEQNFYFPSRSAHIELLQTGVSTQFLLNGDISDYLDKIQDQFDKLDQNGFNFSKDSLLGMAYQLGLPGKLTGVNHP